MLFENIAQSANLNIYHTINPKFRNSIKFQGSLRVEGIEGSIIEYIILHHSILRSYATFNIYIFGPFCTKDPHAFRHSIYINAPSTLQVKLIGVRKPNGMVRSDINVEPRSISLKIACQKHILSFLAAGAVQILDIAMLTQGIADSRLNLTPKNPVKPISTNFLDQLTTLHWFGR